jgi:hypothetical protein
VAAEPHSSSKLRLRADHLILSVGMVVVMVISYLLIRTGSSLANNNAIKSTDPWFRTPASAIEIFKNDVLVAIRRSQSIFSRSTLLLSCAVVIAFVGVAIFYVTLPHCRTLHTLALWHIVHLAHGRQCQLTLLTK